MTRRAVRRLANRRAAVVGIVAENETATARVVAAALYKNLTETIFDLQMLERQGRLISERVMPLAPTAPSRIYRLPTAEERAGKLALERRLRSALHAAVEPPQADRGAFWHDLDQRMTNPAFRDAYDKQTRRLNDRQETDRG